MALDVSGYKRRTIYDWRDADVEFRDRWDEAISSAVEAMEAEADRRGIEGTLKPVFYKGVECGYIREFSDTLLVFRLKALAPDKYREQSNVEVTGKGWQPLEVNFTIGKGYQPTAEVGEAESRELSPIAA